MDHEPGERFLFWGNTLALSGFWSDLWDEGKDYTEQAARDYAQQKIDAQYYGDHIAAQNAALQDITDLLNTFNASRPHSDRDYQYFESKILGIAARFTAYAQSLNSPRAIQGASEIMALARQIVADREMERKSGYTGGIFGAGMSLSSLAIPVGVIAFLYFSKKRR